MSRPVVVFPKRIWNFFRSIRFRLMLWSELILGIVLLLFSAFVYVSQMRDLRAAALNRLMVKAEQVEALSRSIGSTNPAEDAPPFPQSNPGGIITLQEGEILVLADSSGQVLQQVGSLSTSELTSLVQTGQSLSLANDARPVSLEGKLSIAGKPAQDYLLVVRQLPLREVRGDWFVIGSPLDPYGQLPRLVVTLILASLGMLFIAAAGGYWLAGKAMHPVQLITRAAREISESDLSRRLNLKTQDELGELANTFDQMLARLQAAFERQRQFTADASHELRTPLTIVGLEAGHALENHRPVQEYERSLRVIQSENEFMSGLVNDLLTLARMDAGQTTLRMEELDLSDVALEAVERLMPLAARKKIELATGELPELLVNGDRQLLFQMITNLVDNAIKYTQDCCSHIRVETGQDGAQAWVQVEDDGPGIAPEHLPHLFERFYRVDKARARSSDEPGGTEDDSKEYPSSGLGLSIVQWIAKVHGGQVQVQSRLGNGSVFKVSLPSRSGR